MKKSEDRETVHNTVKPRMMIIAPEEENILLQVFSRITAKKEYISLGNIDPLQDLYIQPSDTDSFFLLLNLRTHPECINVYLNSLCKILLVIQF